MQTEKSTGKKQPYSQEAISNDNLLTLEKLSKKYNENNIPLYLSYPTSSWWKSQTGTENFVEAFDSNTSPFLYFHFPYCKKGCYYCMCYKYVSSDESKNDTYIEYLKKEFSDKIDILGRNNVKEIKQIHWGGGTPTFLTCRQIEKIFTAIEKKITIADASKTNISIEGYPDDKVITLEKLKLLRSLGFNEISFGVQDFDGRVQKAINRKHSKEAVEKLIDRSKALGFNVNVDLCYGLPFQGINELEQTVKEIARMDVDRIAMFTYVHYPMIFPMQKVMPASSIPNSFLRVLMAENAEMYLETEGYHKVGYDHFVKKEHPLYQWSQKSGIVRDFMGYSVEDRKQFIGFGNSAISFFGNQYFHNKTSLKDYYNDIASGRMPFIEDMGHRMSRDDIIRNEIIQQYIMCDFKIDKKKIGQKFDIDFDETFKVEINKLHQFQRDGLVDFVGSDTIEINKTGEKFIRHIAYVFDRYYNAQFD